MSVVHPVSLIPPAQGAGSEPRPDADRGALDATQRGIIADEGPFHVDGWYITDPITLGHSRAALARALIGVARRVRALARAGALPPADAVDWPEPARHTARCPRCAYCTRLIKGAEAAVWLRGGYLHNAAARPCYAAYDAECQRWLATRLHTCTVRRIRHALRTFAWTAGRPAAR